MFTVGFAWLVILALLVWLAVLTYLLLKALANYNSLTRGTSDKTLSQLLTDFLKGEAETQQELKKNLQTLAQIRTEAKSYVQKIGIVRFNPFADTGGDQSFSLALLDGNDDGIILTSFYARTGIRWYVKTIRRGKGVEHELSEEEKAALKKAMHVK